MDVCQRCGNDLPPASGSRVRLFCSQECRQKAKDARKTERYRTDPGYRAQVNARQTKRYRAQGGQPRLTGGTSTCPECGTDFPSALKKVYCSDKHRRQAASRRYGGGLPVVCIMATGPTGRAYPTRAKVPGNGGLLVECPVCEGLAVVPYEMELTKYERWCRGCEVVIRLNPEEYEWLVYETELLHPRR